jgi:hypothetical protein
MKLVLLTVVCAGLCCLGVLRFYKKEARLVSKLLVLILLMHAIICNNLLKIYYTLKLNRNLILGTIPDGSGRRL